MPTQHDITSAAPRLAASPFARVRPSVNSGRTRITSGFLAERMRTNRETSLLYGLQQLESGGNLHNLEVAAGDATGYHPTLTLDADVHKWLEAVGWELGRESSGELHAAKEKVLDLLLRVQEEDGYLNSWFQAVEPDRKLTDLTRGCELYCAGHLIEAGVVLSRTLGDKRLLDASCRFADLLVAEFGEGGRAEIDGHEEVELALVELYRETGEQRYLDLAERFIDERGHGLVGPGVFGPRYYQDHEPVREAETITGHAVRAMYLATGAADVYLEKGDPELLTALARQWDSMVSTKMYLTGGLGSRERDEAIGEPYELSPDRAYCETCAAAGLIFWNWKMLQATGDPRYADLLERTLYNAFLAGVSIDGRAYFYANPLEVRADHEAPHESEWSGETPWYISPAPEQATSHRRPWFRCACCPPNVMRVLSSLEQYIATSDDSGLQIQQFASGTIDAELDGRPVAADVQTDYPWNGTVTVTVTETTEAAWTLSLRIPGWAEGATVQVDEDAAAADPGYWSATREWKVGDTIRLELPLIPRATAPMPRASAVYGTVAIERGPLVYCVEQADNGDVDLGDIRVAAVPELADGEGPELVPGLVAVSVGAGVVTAPQAGAFAYRPADGVRRTETPTTLTAIPYFAWANRGGNAMRVWLPTE
ncbi:beta-L-arabinofuranosidase domain-containing protein [Leifsonia sp. C5G2]|uniref:glycoside hydrolase family 127 protein n=1 Tax=Leifsonia sp. C5G2 TaxID=2735269 RepID=UPI0015849A9B|nr:beta-L-arabinofuranosidase domain-containing protein [Leifsonia sp. C5G2]NUU05233.1 glycoside hydrolase family 127 protein [Leifsonia sp. C5G2]